MQDGPDHASTHEPEPGTGLVGATVSTSTGLWYPLLWMKTGSVAGWVWLDRNIHQFTWDMGLGQNWPGTWTHRYCIGWCRLWTKYDPTLGGAHKSQVRGYTRWGFLGDIPTIIAILKPGLRGKKSRYAWCDIRVLVSGLGLLGCWCLASGQDAQKRMENMIVSSFRPEVVEFPIRRWKAWQAGQFSWPSFSACVKVMLMPDVLVFNVQWTQFGIWKACCPSFCLMVYLSLFSLHLWPINRR